MFSSFRLRLAISVFVRFRGGWKRLFFSRRRYFDVVCLEDVEGKESGLGIYVIW